MINQVCTLCNGFSQKKNLAKKVDFEWLLLLPHLFLTDPKNTKQWIVKFSFLKHVYVGKAHKKTVFPPSPNTLLRFSQCILHGIIFSEQILKVSKYLFRSNYKKALKSTTHDIFQFLH